MSDPQKTGLSDNSIGAIAYFTPFMAIFFLAIRRYNKRPYVRFHAWQSLLFNAFALCFLYLLAYILPYLRFLGPRTWVGLVILSSVAVLVACVWLWCIFSALSGKRFKLPLIGNWADEQAYR
jgi:uncharacterized membrane protein